MKAAAAKLPNVISLFGTRNGMSDEEGIANCIAGLNRVKKYAENEGVTICIELLNSKVDHHDYIGDHTGFGVVGNAIADLNFEGYIAHKWLPTSKDSMPALRKAVAMMTA